MSIFGTIMSKIFGHPAANAAPAGTAPAGTTPADAGAAPAAPSPSTPVSPVPASLGTPAQQVDVGAVLTQLASQNGQGLNWKQSIVDLMKLVGLDSSLENRKSLAQELHYTGDMNDSASMNIWLHKQVMAKLAENGGQVPADLKD